MGQLVKSEDVCFISKWKNQIHMDDFLVRKVVYGMVWMSVLGESVGDIFALSLHLIHGRHNTINGLRMGERHACMHTYIPG